MSKTQTGSERVESLNATVAGQQLAEFPIGSLESRAAARRLLEVRGTTREKGLLIQLDFIGADGEEVGATGKVCTCKEPPAGTVALCRCFTNLGT
jgi:hypothetical protein